jgi:hypothetical protein
MVEYKVETPNSAKALKKTLDKLTQEGWHIPTILSDATGWHLAGWFGQRRYTVIAARDDEVST